jgi:hypothetical protein
MRLAGTLALALCLATTSIAWTAAAPSSDPMNVAIAGLSHSLDGAALAVNGLVENRGLRPVSGLVIDATGIAPSGNPSSFGSDGIPWEIRPGSTASFAIRLPLAGRLVRDYTVQVTLVRAPDRPLATARRSVDVSIYRSLLLSVVRLTSDIWLDRFTVHSDARGWPIEQVTVEAVVAIPGPRWYPIARLEALTFDVPADGSKTLRLGALGATLVSLRVLDVRARATWSD